MNRISREKKYLLRGGASISGIVQGASGVAYTLTMMADLGTKYWAWSRGFTKEYSYRDNRYFINASIARNTILS